MLPFLKQKQPGGVTTEYRKPDQEPEQDESDQVLIACMQDFSQALTEGNHKAAASAFRAAFDLLEMEPHNEIEHDEQEEE